MCLSCTVSEILSLIPLNLKRSCDSEHIPFGGNISCIHSYSFIWIGRPARNLKYLASPITKIWLGQNLKNVGHVTLTTPLLWMVCHRRLGFYTVYLCAKFDDSSFSRSRDIIGGASKLKVGHVTLLTPHLRVICHSYAGTWHLLSWPSG